jgi:hypothetical protein
MFVVTNGQNETANRMLLEAYMDCCIPSNEYQYIWYGLAAWLMAE